MTETSVNFKLQREISDIGRMRTKREREKKGEEKGDDNT